MKRISADTQIILNAVRRRANSFGRQIAQEKQPMSTVSVRYIIDDVPAAILFYTTHLGFAVE
jgi:hypothetical protein